MKTVHDQELHFRILQQWVPNKMGVTGPTLPFLIGATRPDTLDNEIATIADLGVLLYGFQRARASYIRIAPCSTIHEPVAALYPKTKTMETRELIQSSRGTSFLYLDCAYNHKQDIDLACEALWSLISHAITRRLYSFNNNQYGTYTTKDLAFIEAVGGNRTRP